MRLVISEDAEFDIANIAKYTSEEWGDLQKNAVLKAIKDTIKNIILFPKNAMVTEKPGVFVKKIPKLPFLIVYFLQNDELVVVNILHDKMNR